MGCKQGFLQNQTLPTGPLVMRSNWINLELPILTFHSTSHLFAELPKWGDRKAPLKKERLLVCARVVEDKRRLTVGEYILCSQRPPSTLCSKPTFGFARAYPTVQTKSPITPQTQKLPTSGNTQLGGNNSFAPDLEFLKALNSRILLGLLDFLELFGAGIEAQDVQEHLYILKARMTMWCHK